MARALLTRFAPVRRGKKQLNCRLQVFDSRFRAAAE
jgi:hypothetical protein